MQLEFDQSQLCDNHTYAKQHEVMGHRLHGGFDEQGCYVPPRSRSRCIAMANWTAALRERGGELFDADASLLTGPRMPNPEQQALLLRNGFTRSFWNTLTVTGKLEARGRLLADVPFPDMQKVLVEDIGDMALGHLNKGLLWAHGIDEGGQPDEGIGGHDLMWFVARDLVIEPGSHPDVEPPENIARPEAHQRWMPQLPQEFEGMLSLLMNLLMIEFRAEIGFSATQKILRNPQLFTDRREAAELAAEIIERIRTDELIHVESLRIYLGELRELTFKTVEGGTIPAREVIDPFWQGLVDWAVHEQPRLAAKQQLEALEPMIREHGGSALFEQFMALGDNLDG